MPMNTRSILPYYFDPRRTTASARLLDAATLHLLLFEQLVIVDGWLVSALFERASRSRPGNPLTRWIEEGWIRMALRDGADSLPALKDLLLRRARSGSYLPFEGSADGIALYTSTAFGSYLDRLADALSATKPLTWSEATQGVRLRAQMRASAATGASGLPAEMALATVHAIDTRLQSESHSRTAYWAYISEGMHDPRDAGLLRAWVSREYLKNLPAELGIGLSVPRKLLHEVGAYDPLAELATVRAHSGSDALVGRDCAILSRTYLRSLTFAQLATLRRSDEFRDLQLARRSNDADRLAMALGTYLRVVGASVATTLDPPIRHLQLLLRTLPGVGAVLAAANPQLGVALAVASLFLGPVRALETTIARRQAEALQTAAEDPFTDEIAEVTHG